MEPKPGYDDVTIAREQMRAHELMAVVGSTLDTTRTSRVFLEAYSEQGVLGYALLDSGASINSVSYDWLVKANLHSSVLPDNPPRFAKDFNGNMHKLRGTIKLSLTLGRARYAGTFSVINSNTRNDLILGLHFLDTYGLTNLLRDHLATYTGPSTVLASGKSPKNC